MQKLSQITAVLLLLVSTFGCIISALPVEKQDTASAAVHLDSAPNLLPTAQEELVSHDLKQALFEEEPSSYYQEHQPYEAEYYQPYFINQRQKRQAASDYALYALKENKPVFQLQGGGDYQNRQNWNLGGQAGLGTPVWQSQNGKHAFGVGATYGQGVERYQGQLYKSQPQWGVGGGYRFRW